MNGELQDNHSVEGIKIEKTSRPMFVIQRNPRVRLVVEPSVYKDRDWINFRIEKRFTEEDGYRVVKGLNLTPEEFEKIKGIRL